MPTWEAFIQAARTANGQLELQGQNCKQSHECFAKLLRVSQMRTAHLRADQRILLHMRDRVKVARNSGSMLPPEMFQQWHRRSVSHSGAVAEDEIEVVMQELKDALSSIVAASACLETWRQLGPVLAKLPAAEPEIIVRPGPENLPWPQFQTHGRDGMATLKMSSQPQTMMRARLLTAPEFRLGAKTATVPNACDSFDGLRSVAKVRHSNASRSSQER